jgi:hypothetical protein
LSVLAEVGAPEKTVFHCFSGDVEMAKKCIERGYVLSFAGTVTFKKIAPTYTTTSGQTISSDLAYEIVQDFPKKSGSKFESTLSGKRQFFINTTDKKFEAIIEFKNENKDGKTSPIVLLKE